MDGMLSQEEINALLNGTMDDAKSVNDSAELLTEAEKDAVGEIANISMGTAATTLFSLVNTKVTITTPVVTYATWDDIAQDYDRPCVFIQISYKDGLDGNNILILKERDVKVITDLMMGGDGTNVEEEISELHVSAICEAMNQMMGSSATSLSSMLNKVVDISPPVATVVDLNDTVDEGEIASFLTGTFIKVAFKMEIEGLVDSSIMQLYPVEFAKELYEKFVATHGESEVKVKSTNEVPAQDVSQQQMTGQPQQTMEGMGVSMQQPYMQMPYMQPTNMQQQPYMQQPYMQTPPQNIQPAQFQPFTNTGFVSGNENIDLIMDVPLQVTVELGRTSKSIQEILEFSPGTIIELNKIAGEPIDVLVNGKYVAKGEVVVIEESFGVRITEIIK
ncbi:flagellar motor switch phosphatase FliY [Candidatus Galacturonibacter soehngenii]|uniref:Flagellar motor switch phosphatase FliY n=1 Tax=Candidatus Galacturonatibacter soehngenii TaxID=2307010 RepID=A0A7V7QJA4_9FIRM|nr:flagellar motor switch phosphatase FliY [Candidatus Galacturonibacter soehngenii]KAB1437697.1 flagellar motor switch phosphatase FliY [Candidatus Galacturonibacter soehngenii]MBA4686928.1 flagellar motor switch phosphatase FliY [Candidatus Galacturonibacter soehngenii]